MVGVGVGADDEPHVLDREAGLREGQVEPTEAALAADPGVEEDDAVACRDRPDVAVRDPGPGQGQAQPPDARQGFLSPRRLRPLALAHTGILSGPGHPLREDRQPG